MHNRGHRVPPHPFRRRWDDHLRAKSLSQEKILRHAATGSQKTDILLAEKPINCQRLSLHTMREISLGKEKMKQKILKFIRAFYKKNGYAPNQSEIAQAVGTTRQNICQTYIPNMESELKKWPEYRRYFRGK